MYVTDAKRRILVENLCDAWLATVGNLTRLFAKLKMFQFGVFLICYIILITMLWIVSYISNFKISSWFHLKIWKIVYWVPSLGCGQWDLF